MSDLKNPWLAEMERRSDLYLSQIELLRLHIREKEDELKELKETLGMHCKSQLERVQIGVNIDVISDEVIRYINMEDDLTKRRLDLAEVRDRIINEIFRIYDKYHVQILTLYYVKGWKMANIAHDLHYSVQHTYRIYHAALRAFYDKNLRAVYREKNKKNT